MYGTRACTVELCAYTSTQPVQAMLVKSGSPKDLLEGEYIVSSQPPQKLKSGAVAIALALDASSVRPAARQGPRKVSWNSCTESASAVCSHWSPCEQGRYIGGLVGRQVGRQVATSGGRLLVASSRCVPFAAGGGRRSRCHTGKCDAHQVWHAREAVVVLWGSVIHIIVWHAREGWRTCQRGMLDGVHSGSRGEGSVDSFTA